jgi:deoxyadenosine/deoxycytidine kinase
MLFDLDSTQGEWFTFFTSHIDLNTGEIVYDDPISDARVQIRSIVPFFEERISKRKRAVEHIFNPKSKAMERLTYFEDLTYEQARVEQEDTWDYAITGIENFKDSKTGELITNTRENKIKLMKNPMFDRFIARCLQIISNSGAKIKEETEKNL